MCLCWDNEGSHCPSALPDMSTCWLATSGAAQQVYVLFLGQFLIPTAHKQPHRNYTGTGQWPASRNEMVTEFIKTSCGIKRCFFFCWLGVLSVTPGGAERNQMVQVGVFRQREGLSGFERLSNSFSSILHNFHDPKVQIKPHPCLHSSDFQVFSLRVTATGMETFCESRTNSFALQLYGIGWGLGCSLLCMRDFSGESTIVCKHHCIWWKDVFLSHIAGNAIIFKKWKRFIGKNMLLETHLRTHKTPRKTKSFHSYQH